MKRRSKVTKTAAKSSTVAKKQPSTGPSNTDGPVSLAIDHIDALLEKIRTNKVKSYDETLISQLKSLVQADIKHLAGQYSTTIDNMKDALAGDAFFLEAYVHFTKPQMKVAVEFLKALKGLKHDDSSSKIRKQVTRAKKVKPAATIVKSVLYLVKDAETGVEGLTPEVLVGAQQLWVYNTKTRKLGCYVAKNSNGLSAKGTTIIDYDEEKSTFKTLRKPKEQLWKFMSQGLKFWEAIRSVPQKMPPRTNRETLLLKIA